MQANMRKDNNSRNRRKNHKSIQFSMKDFAQAKKQESTKNKQEKKLHLKIKN
jgi:hypothetical protein